MRVDGECQTYERPRSAPSRHDRRFVVIRVACISVGTRVEVEVLMDGRFVFASPYDLEVIGKLMELGVPDPIPLVQGARNWGAVEIHDREEDAPNLRPLR